MPSNNDGGKIECEFCSHQFPDILGRYGCPNCLGEDRSAAARKLAGMRKRVPHSCVICGGAFIAISKAVYCSNACRQKAKARRNRNRCMHAQTVAMHS